MLDDNAETLSSTARLVGWGVILFLDVLFPCCILLSGALHMIPHLCLDTLSFEGYSPYSPATVLLRHRSGRRVAAEAGLVTMLLRYHSASVSWVSFHTFV